MSESEIKRTIQIAARNIAVALINHDEIAMTTHVRDKGGRLVDMMDVVEKIVREQLEGSLIVGPGRDGVEDDIERARR